MIVPAGAQQYTGTRVPTPTESWRQTNPEAEWSSLPAGAKHERILCAAGHVFSTQGLGAPMPAVASAAGAGVGSLYRQFPSKHDLVAALVVRRLGQITDAAKAAGSAAVGEHWDALVNMLWTVVERDQADDFLGEAIILVDAHPNVSAALSSTQAQLARLLTAVQAEGRLRKDATSLDLRLLFAATRAAKAIEPHAWQRMLTLLIDGLAAPAGRQARNDVPNAAADK